MLSLLLMSPGFAQAQHKAALPQNGLIAHYSFTGNAEDASPYQNHGQPQGGVSFTEDRFGNPCRALWFNGRDAYVRVPHSASLASPTEGLTVAAWFKLPPDVPQSDLQWVSVCCKSDWSVENEFSPQYRFQSTKVTMSVSSDFTEPFRQELKPDTWYFYTLTYDREQVAVFLNAAKVWEFAYQKKLIPNDLPLDIGRDVPGVTEFFAGVMDEVRLYNRPLRPEEIQQLYEDDSEQKVAFNPCGEITPASIPELGMVEVQQEIVVSQSKIKVYYFDHEQEDGDIVSLWFDGQWVLDRQKIEKKKARRKAPHLNLTLRPGQEYLLVSKAWNLGKIPPNTLTLEIESQAGQAPQSLTLNSSIGKSGAVRLRYIP